MQPHEHLILLHHARRCDATPCPIYPDHLCASAKQLWKHIAECRTYKEGCSHCNDERHLLTHYRNCRDPGCQTCGPVREVIRREKEERQLKQIQSISITKTDTFSTATTRELTAATSVVHPPRSHKSTIDEWVACSRLKSIGSVSSLSHDCGSSVVSSSVRSSAPSGSVRSGDNGSSVRSGNKIYCSECRKKALEMGWPRVQQMQCSSGIRCRNNLGIAHFCKVGSTETPRIMKGPMGMKVILRDTPK